jgi:hypothetical protein
MGQEEQMTRGGQRRGVEMGKNRTEELEIGRFDRE